MKPEEIERIKNLLPTELGSDELREKIAADILRRAVFSARMASLPYLALVRDVCAEISAGSINQADARARLLEALERMGHSPQDGGGLSNPASIRRLNLIIDTQTQMASSVARLAGQTEGVLAQFPAWELTRLETRRTPRADWAGRWAAAGQSCNFAGALQDRFIALKNSPIWDALGRGAGGYTDTLGNPYPPFAYSSGMDWLDVDRETCERLGLISPDAQASAPGAPSLTPSESDIADAVERYGFPSIMEGLA